LYRYYFIIKTKKTLSKLLFFFKNYLHYSKNAYFCSTSYAAIHNKDYSVVKTSSSGRFLSPRLFFPHLIAAHTLLYFSAPKINPNCFKT